MTLTNDTENYVLAFVAAEDLDIGAEFDAGVGYLVQLLDVDVAAGGLLRLTFEDNAGEPQTITVPGDQTVDRWIPVTEANAPYLTVADLVQIERQVAAAPPPSPRQEELLRRAFAPVLRAQVERRAA